VFHERIVNESSPATAVSSRGSVRTYNGSQPPKDDRRASRISADYSDDFGVGMSGILTDVRLWSSAERLLKVSSWRAGRTAALVIRQTATSNIRQLATPDIGTF
jgi:hypothetical protein